MNRPDPLAAARQIARALFENPPISRGELKTRLAGANRDALRRALVDHLEADLVPARDHALFVAAIHAVKPGPMKGRLSAVVLDRARPRGMRELAYRALLASDRSEAQRVTAKLAPDDLATLMEAPLRRVAQVILEEDSPGEALLPFVAPEFAEAAASAIFELERERPAHGVSATELYGPALDAGLLRDQRRELVGIIAADRSEAAALLLDRMRENAGPGDEALRVSCQEAALRLRSALIVKDTSPPRGMTGRAWVTTCDGQGAFTIIAEIDGRAGREPALANLCIRAAADVRDGFHEPSCEPEQIAEIRARLSDIAEVVSISLADAAALAAAGASRTQAMGARIPRDARRPLAMLERIPAADLPEWPVEPARTLPSIAALTSQLTDRRHLEMSWFFDEGDFSVTTLPPWRPSSRHEARAEFIEGAARALDLPQMRVRVIEMARHEARCRAWAGRPEEAAVFVALGVQIERVGMAGSVLVKAMLNRSVDLMTAGARDGALPIGDPVLRQSLRSEFFGDVDTATGRDLARLDFTECTLVALESVVNELPGERRPRGDAMRQTAHAIGVFLADAVIASSPHLNGQPTPTSTSVDGLLATGLGLTRAEVAVIAPLLADHHEHFAIRACFACPVNCLARPKARVDREFHAPTHPSES